MIDARGRSCPEPVIRIKKAMESGEAHYELVSDRITAAENVARYAESNGYAAKIEQSGEDFVVKMDKK